MEDGWRRDGGVAETGKMRRKKEKGTKYKIKIKRQKKKKRKPKMEKNPELKFSN